MNNSTDRHNQPSSPTGMRTPPIPAARAQTLINPARLTDAEVIFSDYADKYRGLDLAVWGTFIAGGVALFGLLLSLTSTLPLWAAIVFIAALFIAGTQVLSREFSVLHWRSVRLRASLHRSLTDASLFRPVALLTGFYVNRQTSEEARWEAAGLAQELISLQQLLEEIAPYAELAEHREREKLEALHRCTELRSAIALLLDPPGSPDPLASASSERAASMTNQLTPPEESTRS